MTDLTDFERSKSRPLAEVLRHYSPDDFEPLEFARTGDDLLDQFPQSPMLRRFKPPTHKPRRPAMRVESVYTVTGRGIGLGVCLAGPAPSLNRRWFVVRPRDGAEWLLKGIERFQIRRDLAVGDKIGLLVPSLLPRGFVEQDGSDPLSRILGSEIAEGDVVEFVEEAANP